MTDSLEITPEYYDLIVNWDRRLAREGPFYRRLFDDLGARRVLDAACGTARHLILFAGQGLACTGSDADPTMVEAARANAAAAGVGIDFFVAPFADLPGRVGEPFDVVLCVGNGFSMVPDQEAAASAVGLASAVRPGGALVLHVLNADRFAEREPVFMPLGVREKDGRTVLFQKIFEPRADGLGVHFILIEEQPDGSWQRGVRSNVIASRGLDAYRALLSDAGFTALDVFGDYQRGPLSPDSDDLIIVARKG